MVHFHSSDVRFCGSKAFCRQTSSDPNKVDCPNCCNRGRPATTEELIAAVRQARTRVETDAAISRVRKTLECGCPEHLEAERIHAENVKKMPPVVSRDHSARDAIREEHRSAAATRDRLGNR